MLGVCNTCVRLQSRVTSSGATVHGLVFIIIIIVIIIIIIICFYSSCCLFFVCYYLLCILLYIMYLLLLIIFSIWDGVRTKNRFFQKGWGMGVEALIRKNTVFFGGGGGWALYNLCWPEYLGSILIWFRVGEMWSCNLFTWED